MFGLRFKDSTSSAVMQSRSAGQWVSGHFTPFVCDIGALSLSVCPQDVSGMSLSMLAAAGGQDDILRLLIKKGVKMNGRQKNGTTALMHAAEKVNSV